MATYTTNYNLTKIALTDAPPDITVLNANWEIIDKALPLKTEKTIYVTTAGNDATGNGTSSAPYRTMSKAVSMLPKDLGGFDVTIYVGAGSYAETLHVDNFSNGRILFYGLNNATVAVSMTGFEALNTNYCQFTSTVNVTVGTAGFYTNNNSLVIMTGNLTCNGGEYAVNIDTNANFVNNATTTVNNASTAVRVNNGHGRFNLLAGSGNTTGLYCVAGGKLEFTNSASLTATTKFQTTTGGRIYSGSQTSIPNY